MVKSEKRQEKTESITKVHNNLGLGIDVFEYGTDKEYPKQYLSRIYDLTISHLKEEEITFMEIGVRSGASVKLWTSYFPRIHFYGVDNGTDVVWQNEDWVQGKTVTYINADAYTPEINKVISEAFDVIIDDGPHTLESQKYAVYHFTSKLKKDGYLFIEDIQGNHRWRDELISSLPGSFKGCARVFDLREHTGEGDAYVLLLHNCDTICSLKLKNRNELRKLPTIGRRIKWSSLTYHSRRNLLKIKCKLQSLRD